MTAFDRFDDRFGARLHDAIEDLASPQYPDYIDDVLPRPWPSASGRPGRSWKGGFP